MQRVEDELGLTVFERGHNGLRVTRGGAAVLTRARRLLADLVTLKEIGMAAALGAGGEIRLGIRLPSVGEPVQGLLTEWRQSFPEVELRLFELNERDIMIGMEDGRLDVAFMTKHTL